MRISLKGLTEEEKREHYKRTARERYVKRKGKPARKNQTGLTDEEKKEKRRLYYLEKTEGKVKRQPDYSSMTDEEKKKFLSDRQKEYNKKGWAKKIPKTPRKLLVGLTDEEKKERRREANKRAYRKKREELGLPIRLYRKLTPEEKEKERLEKEILKEEKKRLRIEKSISLKEQKKKVKVEKIIKVDKTSTKFVKNNELIYQIILSKGKGDSTEKLKMMLYKMVSNINRRFSYYDEDMRYDIMMETYSYILTKYNSFDENKYNNAFAYMTEIIKRCHTKFFHQERNKGIKINYYMYDYSTSCSYVSTSDTFNL